MKFVLKYGKIKGLRQALPRISRRTHGWQNAERHRYLYGRN